MTHDDVARLPNDRTWMLVFDPKIGWLLAFEGPQGFPVPTGWAPSFGAAVCLAFGKKTHKEVWEEAERRIAEDEAQQFVVRQDGTCVIRTEGSLHLPSAAGVWVEEVEEEEVEEEEVEEEEVEEEEVEEEDEVWEREK